VKRLLAFYAKYERRILLMIAGFGTFHFVVGTCLWIVYFVLVLFKETNDPATLFLYLLFRMVPCILFFCAFITSLILVFLRKLHTARMLASMAVVLSSSLFMHDALTHNFQMRTSFSEEGCQHYYFTWWWYNDSWDPHR